MSERRLISLFLAAVTASVWWGQAPVAADTVSPVHSPHDAVLNTAAVVEGRVTDIRYAFDQAAGPRTVATLDDVTTHFGTFGDRTLAVATLGGPITPRRWLFISELPRLTTETRYVLFLTNVRWFFSPLVGDYLFRVEPDDQGREVLIDLAGRAVLGLTAAGLQLSPKPVVDMHLDFLTPHAKPEVSPSDRAVLGRAMSKAAFLVALGEILRAVPLSGSFERSPAAGRVWNRMSAEEEIGPGVGPRPAPGPRLVCADPATRKRDCPDTSDRQ